MTAFLKNDLVSKYYNDIELDANISWQQLEHQRKHYTL